MTKMLTVMELAKQAGVTPHMVRYYARIGLLKPKRHPLNRYRQFTDFDIRHLRFINKSKRLGFKLSEIAEILRMGTQGRPPCPMVRTILQQRIQENRIFMKEFNVLQKRMEKAAAQWQEMPDGIPDGSSICKLIESIADA